MEKVITPQEFEEKYGKEDEIGDIVEAINEELSEGQKVIKFDAKETETFFGGTMDRIMRNCFEVVGVFRTAGWDVDFDCEKYSVVFDFRLDNSKEK